MKHLPQATFGRTRSELRRFIASKQNAEDSTPPTIKQTELVYAEHIWHGHSYADHEGYTLRVNHQYDPARLVVSKDGEPVFDGPITFWSLTYGIPEDRHSPSP